VNKSK
jgi:hypothetical protein